jgi:acyl-CoA synthetase (AMP-forming)/AMP-acid ligase II
MIEPLGAWPAPPSADAIALLIYTSGTTGKPKGVMLSHAALAANLGAVAEAWRFDTRDVVVNMLPLHHVHGLGLATLATLLAGAAVELHPRFDAPTLVAAIAGGATVFMGVPTMYHLLLEHLGRAPADADVLRRARLFTAGSAALPAAAFARFAALTGHHILERYGMTETLFTLSNPYDGPRVPGAVGQPIAGVTVRLVDEFGAPAGAGPGEIEVRGDGLMTGYWQRPAATAAAFRDGWFRTGDTAVIEAGSYRIVGRTSTDIIKSGGYKLGAREIEDAIVGTGLVSECAVLGVPDEKWGELVGAVCVRPGRARRSRRSRRSARRCRRPRRAPLPTPPPRCGGGLRRAPAGWRRSSPRRRPRSACPRCAWSGSPSSAARPRCPR